MQRELQNLFFSKHDSVVVDDVDEMKVDDSLLTFSSTLSSITMALKLRVLETVDGCTTKQEEREHGTANDENHSTNNATDDCTPRRRCAFATFAFEAVVANTNTVFTSA